MTRHKAQTIAKIIYVRLKVTIFLYLSPNNRARSRSTLIAVNVDKDTEHNAWLDMTVASLACRRKL